MNLRGSHNSVHTLWWWTGILEKGNLRQWKSPMNQPKNPKQHLGEWFKRDSTSCSALSEKKPYIFHRGKGYTRTDLEQLWKNNMNTQQNQHDWLENHHFHQINQTSSSHSPFSNQQSLRIQVCPKISGLPLHSKTFRMGWETLNPIRSGGVWILRECYTSED